MFKSKETEISKICRSCLIDTGDMKSLYDQYSANMCVGEVLMSITTMSSLEFYDDIDELPKQICHKCITALNTSYEFVLKCRESEEELRNYLNDVINRKKSNSTDDSSRKLDIITSDNVKQTEGVEIINDNKHVSDVDNDFNSVSTDDKLNIESNLLDNNAFSIIDNDLNNVSTDLGLALPLLAEKRSVLENLLTNTTDYKYNNEKKDMQKENTHDNFKNADYSETGDLMETNEHLFLDHTYIQAETYNECNSAIVLEETPSELEKLLTTQLDNKRNENKYIPKEKTKNVSIENLTDVKYTKISDSIANAINLRNKKKEIIQKRKSNDMHKYTHNKLKDTTKQNLTKLVQNNEEINFHNEFIKSILASDQIARKKIDGRLKPPESRSSDLKLKENHKNQETDLLEDSSESNDFFNQNLNSKSSADNVPNTQHYRKTYLCPFCGTVYKYNSDLKCHMRKHTGEKPYKCSFCNKTFSSSSNLPRHERTHTGERPYSCTVCGRPFIDKPTLVCHMRSHSREKPHPCKMCNKPFSRTSQLIRHMRSHTGEKPHSCTVCSASFIENSTLKIHMRIHTGERPYSCKVCGIAIISKNKLSIHMRRHTGEKPYSCTICHTPFTQSSSLKLHLRNKHKIYIPPSVHYVSNRKTLHD